MNREDGKLTEMARAVAAAMYIILAVVAGALLAIDAVLYFLTR